MSRSRCWAQVGQAAKKQLTARQQCEYAKKSLLGTSNRTLSSSARSLQPVSSSNGSGRSCGRRDGVAWSITAGDSRVRTAIPTAYMTKREMSGIRGTYMAYGLAKRLFAACSEQADYSISEKLRKAEQVPKAESGEEIGEGSGWWYDELGLSPTFSSWAHVTFIHMYLITARLRALPSPENFQAYNRYLFEHFSQESERRMVEVHGITSRGIRVTYLKDLFEQWRGAIAAYDEGLVRGDAQLAAAVWRNLFKGLATDHKGEELDWAKIAKVVMYMRRSLDKLAEFEDTDLLTEFAKGAGSETFFSTAELVIPEQEDESAQSSNLGPLGKPLGQPRVV
ncbi:CBP3 [Nannizzia gypsea CBS 118893]|uniref:CBP3 n=1 Tax=Arthroderma gypseum (strain ATCC MYA-4604 / CBS 118893) TaxID=535722 RepID=E5R205_ARTGP|nr:CBP3 [Nannizzia gypsea CBS 118893]EFQ97784.1 CBP3 [Nannizzia gypsea CBS 118893]